MTLGKWTNGFIYCLNYFHQHTQSKSDKRMITLEKYETNNLSISFILQCFRMITLEKYETNNNHFNYNISICKNISY